MGQEELMNKIAELEREIAILPEGSITKKKSRILKKRSSLYLKQLYELESSLSRKLLVLSFIIFF